MTDPVKDPMDNDPELDSLLGAYALDALDADERARVDDYVAHNHRARDEVDELRESAAALAILPGSSGQAPGELWDRIAAQVAQEPAPVTSLGETRLGETRPARSRWTPLAGIVAVAAAVALLVLALEVVSLHGRLDKATGNGDAAAAAAFDRARDAAGAREVPLMPAHGAAVAQMVLLPDGHGYLKNAGMKQLASDQTYQLWALTGDPNHPTAISAGVLGADPKAAAFRLAGDVQGLALTIEQAPGVVQTAQPLYASASLS